MIIITVSVGCITMHLKTQMVTTLCNLDTRPMCREEMATLFVALCLYYPNGEESLSFHRERDFLLRHQNKIDKQYRLSLEKGSLLVMGKGFQDSYQRALAKGTQATKPRFNISFRSLVGLLTRPCQLLMGRAWASNRAKSLNIAP